MLHLAFMWNVVSVKGIWNPSCGIHGISDMLNNKFQEYGGTLKLNTGVYEIIVKNYKALGLRTVNDETFMAHWIVSNADYKKVFLTMMNPENVPQDHLKIVKNTLYMGSEFCVYLGLFFYFKFYFSRRSKKKKPS